MQLVVPNRATIAIIRYVSFTAAEYSTDLCLLPLLRLEGKWQAVSSQLSGREGGRGKCASWL